MLSLVAWDKIHVHCSNGGLGIHKLQLVRDALLVVRKDSPWEEII